MSTIGVGKAFRSQDREGRRARARAVDKQEKRRAKLADRDYGPIDREVANCVTCGAEDNRGDLYSSGEGLVCASCFAKGEGELVVHTESTFARVVKPLSLWLMWVPFPLIELGVTGWLLDVVLVVWFPMVAFLTLASPAFLVMGIEKIRQDWRRMELESAERAELIAGHLWWGAAYVAAMAGVFTGMSWMGPF